MPARRAGSRNTTRSSTNLCIRLRCQEGSCSEGRIRRGFKHSQVSKGLASSVILTFKVSLKAAGTISTLVIDDEQLARDELLFLLKDFPEIEVLETGANGIDAVKMIESLEPDLVFLDVQMPGLDGLGVIGKLQQMNVALPHFIMATAFDQYAVEAFRLEAMDYLLKPIEKERLAAQLSARRNSLRRNMQLKRNSKTPSSLREPTCSGQNFLFGAARATWS